MLDKFHPYISFAGNNPFNHRTLFSFDRVKLNDSLTTCNCTWTIDGRVFFYIMPIDS